MDMKKLKKGERGFSLVELVIVVALAGLVGAALTATAFQVFTFSTRTSNQMTAIRQVQQAGFWVSPDVMMAQNVTLGGSLGFPLTLTWQEWGTNTTHTVTYNLTYMSGGLKRLQREHKIGTSLNSTTVVAEYIDPTGTSFVQSGTAYNFTVTATVGGQTETRVYEVRPRVGT
jgi:prepilin-type N-terminal cleavage/methylation domain-containing protein